MGLFDRKYCDICGEKIGLLGNRKLADGNLCSDCTKKLSPWFKNRKQSTVAEIREQLVWKEENRTYAEQFTPTKIIGDGWKLLLDEKHGWFAVSTNKDLLKANADILSLDEVTGCDVDMDETSHEVFRRNADGKNESYHPPRYEYDYNFYFMIHVTSPYYDEIRFPVNTLPIEITVSTGMFTNSMIQNNAQYRSYKKMAEEMKQALTCAAEKKIEPIMSQSWTCQYCGKTSNTGKFCENCGAGAQ